MVFRSKKCFFPKKYSSYSKLSKFEYFLKFAKNLNYREKRDFQDLMTNLTHFTGSSPLFPDFWKKSSFSKKNNFCTYLRNLTIPSEFYGRFVIMGIKNFKFVFMHFAISCKGQIKVNKHTLLVLVFLPSLNVGGKQQDRHCGVLLKGLESYLGHKMFLWGWQMFLAIIQSFVKKMLNIELKN